MAATETEIFLGHIKQSIEQDQFIKLTLSDKRSKVENLKNVYVKPVTLKAGKMLSFVFRYPTQDITKNHEPTEGMKHIEELLTGNFHQADLFTGTADWHLTTGKAGKNKVLQKEASVKEIPVPAHDKIKKRAINLENNIYLYELGVTTADWKIKKDMQDKYRQINKYVEIVESIISSASLPTDLSIVDMGSGKGYLTFALYDHLVNNMKQKPRITGVELRKELVDHSNAIAKKTQFSDLTFVKGSIEQAEIPVSDMLIALHACDTATDEAIYRGIKAGSKVIICAPCCHKQIRKQMDPSNELKEITKFGILAERQAEIITDTIRALILEAYGYKTKVFEFISTEHTAKNVLIVGVKSGEEDQLKQDVLKKIKEIKALYNIEFHYLEKLLGL